MNGKTGERTSETGEDGSGTIRGLELLGYMHELSVELERLARMQGHQDLSRIYALAQARLDDLREEPDR